MRIPELSGGTRACGWIDAPLSALAGLMVLSTYELRGPQRLLVT